MTRTQLNKFQYVEEPFLRRLERLAFKRDL